MANYLVTGAAGFIGSHTAIQLLQRGDQVVGLDNLNDYYDPSLKESRLNVIRALKPVVTHLSVMIVPLCSFSKQGFLLNASRHNSCNLSKCHHNVNATWNEATVCC